MARKSKPASMTPEQEIETLRCEFLLFGFAAAKRIAELRQSSSGVMPCPLCQQDLKYSTAPSNGHFRAMCSTMNCINAME